MPAYIASQTLNKSHIASPSDFVEKIVVVDDHHGDDPTNMAWELKIEVIVHPYNVGYGGKQET
jgi:hypothetical protein